MSEQLKKAFEDQRNEILKILDEKVSDLIRTNQENLIHEATEQIERAIKNNANLISANIEIGKEKGRGAKFLSGLKSISGILIPASTTIGAVILGFFIWKQQTVISQQVSKDERTFASQLSIREEYLKRKFNAYEKINDNLITLAECIENSKFFASNENNRDSKNDKPDEYKKNLVDSVSNLFKISKSQEMYLSVDVAKAVSEVWSESVGFTQGAQNIQTVQAKIAEVKAQMKTEMEEAK